MGILIRDLPPEERPRERMLEHGAASLSVVELLAVLLGSGAGRGQSAIALAQTVVAAATGAGDSTGAGPESSFAGTPASDGEPGILVRLAEASPLELAGTRGVGPAKAARIVAGLELGRRLGQARLERGAINSPADVAELIGDRLRRLDREHFVVLLLDTKNHLLGTELVSIGSLDSSIVHPREVFKAAVRRSASAVVLAHNHPSGDPSPSEADLQATRRLEEAGRLLGIAVLDHVIIGDGRFVSLRERGFGEPAVEV